MQSVLEVTLLGAAWLTALVTLVVFLESCFAVTGRNRIPPHRASGAYGVVSVFLPMGGSPSSVQRTIQSVFQQSYPFIELILIYPEDDRQSAGLAVQYRSVRSHIPVRLVPVTFPIADEFDRVRALDAAQSTARGRWLAVLAPDVRLDRFAIEFALEFAGGNELSALSLTPGVRCRSLMESLLAPSLEYFSHVIRLVSGFRTRSSKMRVVEPFMMTNREAFDVVNRINRLPGILNDSGWNVWSYRVEGLRTFDGDGSRWIWRESLGRPVTVAGPARRQVRRATGFVLSSAAMSLITLAGLLYSTIHGIDQFTSAAILAFSAVSFLLMTVSHAIYSRRIGGATWFAPLWFVVHLPACAVALQEIRKGARNPAPARAEETSRHSLP